jgi:hypothetical protein
LWLSREQPPTQLGAQLRFFPKLKWYKTAIINLVLTVQLVAGVFAYGMDARFPFTEAKAAAQFIQIYENKTHESQHPPNPHQPRSTLGKAGLGKAGDPDWAALPVGGYLGQPLYLPASQQVGSFIRFNTQRQDLTPESLAARVNQWTRSQPNQPLLLILNYSLAAHPEAQFTHPPRAIGAFTEALLTDENYYIYEITR